jgi:hypothetical protein
MPGLDSVRLLKQKVQRKTEPAYIAAMLRSSFQPSSEVIPYVPADRRQPPRCLSSISCWKGIETILGDIIERFRLKTETCLEFGVEFGFSTAALSGYFDNVVGVDTFVGDVYSGRHADCYERTANALAPYQNIQLVRSDFRDFIKTNSDMYDLIHVDIIHSYGATFECGLWSAQHSTCTLFHDTESYPGVRKAVSDVARATGKKFYNFAESNGLGIVV